jgi:hypothetical protein
MTRPTTVYRVGPATTANYPRVMPNHPRNRRIDWMQLERYAEHGLPSDESPFDIFVKADQDFDAIWIAGRTGFVVSSRLREVIRTAAGGSIEFLPVTVNGQRFSIMRVLPVVDALDPHRSVVRYDVDADSIKAIELPVWRGDRLVDPLLFTIPQMLYQIWATNTVRQAYDESGCTGLSFWQPGEVV